jgi:S-adenosylmethionine:tRNA ribosyltransferase-isomerase
MSEYEATAIENYRYPLPDSAIAKYPLPDRERSKLLVYSNGKIRHRNFTELPDCLPEGTWMVFNNTKVIQARLAFRKESGARIEVFCLEPVSPSDHQLAFGSRNGCSWKCLVGNARKWKSGPVSLRTRVKDIEVKLEAYIENKLVDSYLIRFVWDYGDAAFGEIIDSAGTTPIPPYLDREAEESDKERYQTVYCRDPGSVAAPTAGLHFTDGMLQRLADRGIPMKELTLHVGAGTFIPVKEKDAREHAMHAELVQVSREFLEYWAYRPKGLVAVGTTSTRSLETLYWLGVKLLDGQALDPVHSDFRQWENESLPDHYSLEESLDALIAHCRTWDLEQIRFSTSLMIIPAYRFRTIAGLITNFHLPGSSLLLLIAALIGEHWRKVYASALEQDYRFLSYGDSSLLFPLTT